MTIYNCLQECLFMIYRCDNCDFEITLNMYKKLNDMNDLSCPECKEGVFKPFSDLDNLSNRDLDIVKNYPLPLSMPYKSLVSEQKINTAYATAKIMNINNILKVDPIIQTITNMLKYFAIILQAEFLHSDYRSIKIYREIENLYRPSLGHWDNFVKSMLAFFESRNHKLFMSEFPDFYDKIERNLSGSDKYVYEGIVYDEKGNSNYEKKLFGYIQALIVYRNKWAHEVLIDYGEKTRFLNEFVTECSMIIKDKIYPKLEFIKNYEMIKKEADNTYTFLNGYSVISDNMRSLNNDDISYLNKNIDDGKVFLYDKRNMRSLDLHPLYMSNEALSNSELLVYDKQENSRFFIFTTISGKTLTISNDMLSSWKETLQSKRSLYEGVDIASVSMNEFRNRLDKLNSERMNMHIEENHFNPDLYIHRKQVENIIDKFNQGSAPIMLLTGGNGTGKSSILYYTAYSLMEDDSFVWFNTGSRIKHYDIGKAFTDDLGINGDFTELFKHLSATKSGGNSIKRITIIIDSLNDHEEGIKLVKSCERIAESLKNIVEIKLLMSFRYNFKNLMLKSNSIELDKGLYYKDMISNDYYVTVQKLERNEIKEMYEKLQNSYDDRYNIQTDFTSIIKNNKLQKLLSQPVYIKLLCSAFNNREIPSDFLPEDIFKEYIERVLFAVKGNKNKRVKSKSRVDFLYDLSSMMLSERSTRINIDDIYNPKTITVRDFNKILRKLRTGEDKELLKSVYSLTDNEYQLKTDIPSDIKNRIGNILIKSQYNRVLIDAINNTQTESPYIQLKNMGIINEYLSGYNTYISFQTGELTEWLIAKAFLKENKGTKKVLNSLLELEMHIKMWKNARGIIKVILIELFRKNKYELIAEFNDRASNNITHKLFGEVLDDLHEINAPNFNTLVIKMLSYSRTTLPTKMKVSRFDNDIIKIINDPEDKKFVNTLYQNDNGIVTLKDGIDFYKEEKLRDILDKAGYSINNDINTILNFIDYLFYRFKYNDIRTYLDMLKIYIDTSGNIWQKTNYIYKFAQYHHSIKEYDDAIFYYKKHIKFFTESVIVTEKNKYNIAKTNYSLGRVYHEMSLFSEALYYYGKALDIYKELYGDCRSTAKCYNSVGLVYNNMGNYREAVNYYQRAIEILKKDYGEHNQYITTSYNNLGLVYYNMGEYDTALSYYKKTLNIYTDNFGEHHPYVAGSYNYIGKVWYNKFNYEKALSYYNKALDIYTDVFGEKDKNIIATFNNIGKVYTSTKDYNKAISYYNRALTLSLEILGKYDRYTASSYNGLGETYCEKGEFDKSLENHNKALQIRNKTFGGDSFYTAQSYYNIAKVYLGMSNYEEALKYFEKALSINLDIFGEQNQYTADVYSGIAEVYQQMPDADTNSKALDYHLNKALKIRTHLFGSNSMVTAETYMLLGDLYTNTGDVEQAVNYQNKALKIKRNIFGDDHIDTINTYNKLQKLISLKNKNL